MLFHFTVALKLYGPFIFSLGMHHDNNGNSCSKDGYIMSPSRGTQGETIWSPCSADVMYNLG